jgi:hypothetical protein
LADDGLTVRKKGKETIGLLTCGDVPPNCCGLNYLAKNQAAKSVFPNISYKKHLQLVDF